MLKLLYSRIRKPSNICWVIVPEFSKTAAPINVDRKTVLLWTEGCFQRKSTTYITSLHILGCHPWPACKRRTSTSSPSSAGDMEKPAANNVHIIRWWNTACGCWNWKSVVALVKYGTLLLHYSTAIHAWMCVNRHSTSLFVPSPVPGISLPGPMLGAALGAACASLGQAWRTTF